jgi:excisionase family DNA binding protein
VREDIRTSPGIASKAEAKRKRHSPTRKPCEAFVTHHALPPTPPNRRLASISSGAAYATVHPKTIRRWIAEGRLTGYRVGPRLIRVDLNEIDGALVRAMPNATEGDDRG